jgi:hypothetical protein
VDVFLHQVKERPLLLIYDGHKSHVHLNLIRTAIVNNVCIIKFPSHITDRLQPLDVACFKPLKSIWDKKLAIYQREHNFRNISKMETVDLLCSVWTDGLSEANIKAGFRATGIYPFDRNQYPTYLFDPLKFSSFKHQNPCYFDSIHSPVSLPSNPSQPSSSPFVQLAANQHGSGSGSFKQTQQPSSSAGPSNAGGNLAQESHVTSLPNPKLRSPTLHEVCHCR